MDDTTEVERFEPYTDEGNREGYGQMEPCESGDWVRVTDYAALAAKLAEVQAQVASDDGLIDRCEDVITRLQARTEAAIPAAYRLGRADGGQGFVTDMSIRALSAEHSQDEKWLIDHDNLLFQRDCDITEARAIRASQYNPTAAELMARINEGEK